MTNKRYWLNWTIACGLGEFLGIAAAAGIAFAQLALIGDPESLGEKMLVMLMMLVAGIIEGTVTGSLQWSVLKRRFTRMRVRDWLLFTALGAVVGWVLGMTPSVFFAPQSSDPATTIDFSTALIIPLSAALGLALGALFGVFQWIELRRHTANAARWIWANALAWMVGMVVIFLGASSPPAGAGLAVIIAIGAACGLLAGLLVGAITGLFLIRLRYTGEG
jgi:hypothetical protein